MNPAVSFVVPCYRLAHLLPQCVESVRAQTYRDWELLVMDDCSPDDTGDVVRQWEGDERIRYVRNEHNLGHLPNYNKGIGLARGRYVWLISADDYLRSPKVLERYVEVLDRHPAVGFAFCPGVGVLHGAEREVLPYSCHAEHDRIFPGRTLLARLVHGNTVLAAAGLVRRECYEKVGRFPLDMPWAGDWYLWCAFALHFDAAYFAEPMVCYREHEMSMSRAVMDSRREQCFQEEIRILLRLRKEASQAGQAGLAEECLRRAAHRFARRAASLPELVHPGGAEPAFDEFLRTEVGAGAARNRLWASWAIFMGDERQRHSDPPEARRWYARALRRDPTNLKGWAKALLLTVGKPGAELRAMVHARRNKGLGIPSA